MAAPYSVTHALASRKGAPRIFSVTLSVQGKEFPEKTLRDCIPSIAGAGGHGVKLDITHGMRRTEHTLTPKHPMIQAFLSDLSTAFYSVNRSDLARVEAFYKRNSGRILLPRPRLPDIPRAWVP